MSEPFFSIIIPTYNRVKLLQNVINDVMSQSIENWELIIVDDGSTDHTKSMVNSINDERIRYFYQNNMGECEARNTGLAKAVGEWICYVDSDDTIKSDYLFCFNDIIDENYKVYCAGTSLWWPRSNKKKEYIPSNTKSELLKEYLNGHYNLMPFCLHHSIARSRSFEKGVYYGGDFQYLLPILISEDIITSTNITSSVVEHSGRIVGRVFQSPQSGYRQMKHSTVDTIVTNRLSLNKFVSNKFLDKVILNKKKNFILGVAGINFSEAIELTQTENLYTIKFIFHIVLQRFKSFIKYFIK